MAHRTVFHSLLDGWSRWTIAHPWHVVAVAILLTAVSAVVLATRFDVSSDIKDLMPEGTQSVQDTYAIADRMGSITTLDILVETSDRTLSPEKKASEAYQACVDEAMAEAEALQARQRERVLLDESERTVRKLTEKEPLPELDPAEVAEHCDDALVLFARELVDELEATEAIGHVHYHNKRNFFEENALLYAPVSDLETLRDDLSDRIEKAREYSGNMKQCKLQGFSDDECDELYQEPGADDETKAEGGKSDLDRKREDANLPDEYMIYQLSDGNWTLKINVRFRAATTSLKSNEEQMEAIDDMVVALDPGSFNDELEIVYGGGFRSQKEEANAIANDIKTSGAATVGAILLLLLIFFRRGRALLIILVPMLMAISWTLAGVFLTIGSLNLITAFIGAVLLGLGIDFGVHVLVRFDQERALGKSVEDALEESVVEVGSANVAGAITTSATFATLMLASFRGFSQFGLVASIGVLVALFSMLTVLPAMVMVGQRVWKTKPRTLSAKRIPHAKDRPRLAPILLLALVAVVVSAGFSASKATEIRFEENFYNLGMVKADWKKDQRRYKVTQDKRHSSPAIVLLDDLAQVSALEKILARRADPHIVHDIRDFTLRYPNLLSRLNDDFAIVFSQLGDEWAVIPAMITTRMADGGVYWPTPKFIRYDSEGTRAVETVAALRAQMPGAIDALAALFAAPLRHVPLWGEPIAGSPEMTAGRRDNGKLSAVREWASIYTFMPGTPKEQAEKLAILAEIRDITSYSEIRFLPDEDEKQVRELREYLVTDTISVDELPLWVKKQFKEGGEHPAAPREGSGVDFAFGNVVLVFQTTSSMIGPEAHRFYDEMRTIEIDGETPIMSTNAFVFSDMLRLVQSDGLNVAWIALLLVLLVVFVQHRSVLQTIVITAPVLVALTWTAGWMVFNDLKLSMFNIVCLPLIIGIGIDDGIHLYHRYRENGRGGMLNAMRFTGGSIFVTSATTICGFGGMMLSNHMGINAMGELAVVGIAACWLATMTVSPALVWIAERFELRSLLPEHEYDPDAGLALADAGVALADASVVLADASVGDLGSAAEAASPTPSEATGTAAADSGESAAADSGESAAAESGESAAADSGESAAAESGESAAAESGESAAAESGESAVADSGESAASDSAESAAVHSAESAAAESGESAAAKSGESAAAKSGESAAADSGESAAADSGDSGETPKV